MRRWFEYAIDNQSEPQSRKIYIVEDDEGKSVGHMYIIPNGEEYDLPVAIRSEFGGKGYAKAAISMGLKEGKRLGFKKMVGSIREDNIASMKAYISCGVKVLEEYRLVYIPKLNREVKMFIVEYVY